MAARKKAKAPVARNEPLDINPRHLWLASLGTVATAKRSTYDALLQVCKYSQNAVADARFALRQIDTMARTRVNATRSSIQPQLVQLSGLVDAALAPIATRLGMAIKPRRTAKRKAATPQAKTASRKATRQSTGRKMAKGSR